MAPHTGLTEVAAAVIGIRPRRTAPETSPSERSVVSRDMLKAAMLRHAYGAPGSVVELAHDGV